MSTRRKWLVLFLGAALSCGCGNDHKPAAGSSDLHAVDSAAKAAPDTIRASMDTSSRR